MACQGFYLSGFREGKKRGFLAYFYLCKGVKWGYSDQLKRSPFEHSLGCSLSYGKLSNKIDLTCNEKSVG